MNKRDYIKNRTINKVKLESSSWKNIDRLEFSFSNNPDKSESIEHKLAKTICFILLKNGVPAEQLPSLEFNDFLYTGSYLASVYNTILMYGTHHMLNKDWERPIIVTEARFKPIQKGANSFGEKMFQVLSGDDIIIRRADLFILDTGEIVEIETDHKIKKAGAITVYI